MGLLDKLLGASDRRNKDVSLENNPDAINNVNPISSISEQSNDEQRLIAYVREFIDESRQNGSRVANEAVWMTNVAYILGFDSIYYDTTSRQFRTIGKTNNILRRNRIRVNKMLPTLQRRLARLCKNTPRFEVRPDEGSQESKDRARLEQQIAEDYWDRELIQMKRLQATQGAQQCGHSWFRVLFDTDKGGFLDNEDSTEKIREGDVGVEVCSAFEVFPDPLATDQLNLRKLVHAKIRPLEYFRKKYPERGHLVKEEGPWLLSLQYEARINTIVGAGPSSSGISQQMKNCAIECSYYEQPSVRYPDGRLVITSNGILLANRDLPVGEIPFVRLDDIPIDGKFYPEALATHLRPIQDQYNRTIQARADWVNRCARGKFMACRGHGLQAGALNDQSGEVLEYDHVPDAPPPSAMAIPVIPAYMYNETAELDKMFYDLAGEGDVSRGILPSASIPAIGMQLLLEQDETRISIMTEQHELAFARLFRLILLYAEKFVTTERLIKRTGPDSEYQIEPWTGGDIESDHDIIVKRGSMAPTSKAQKRNDIMTAFSGGLLGAPTDPNVLLKVLRSLEYGDLSDFWQDIALDTAQTKRNISVIEKGEIPTINEGDNHVLAYQEMNKYRKSDKFNDLDSKKQATFLFIMEEHLQHLTALTAPQMGMSPDPKDDLEMFNMKLDSNFPPEMQANGPAGQQMAGRTASLAARADQSIPSQEVK